MIDLFGDVQTRPWSVDAEPFGRDVLARIRVAIDPGVRALGYAVERDGEIVRAGVSVIRASVPVRLTAFARIHAERILADGARFDAAHVESMRWRPNDARSQPNDLLDVQTVGVLTAARLSDAVTLHTPQEWKRNLPKTVHHNRISRILRPSEIRIVDAAIAAAPAVNAKEILDAVGLSLYVSGRIDSSGRPTANGG